MKFPLPQFLKRLAGGLLGQFHWSPPPWLRWISRTTWTACRRRPKLLFVTLLIAAGAGWGGTQWWRWREAHRVRPDPKPVVFRELAVSAGNPSFPGYDKEKKQFLPSPLSLRFSGPAAPLAKAGIPREKDGEKPAETKVEGVSLDPPHAGQWRWDYENTLTFYPSAPWPPGRAYTVTLDASLALALEVRLQRRSLSVTTAPVTAMVESMEFYIDPTDPANQQVVGSLRVSHPFAKEELEKHLTLGSIGGTPLFATGGARWTLVPDLTEPRHWWMRSARVTVPPKEDFAVLTLTPGLKSTDGGEPLAQASVAKMVVRDKFSGLSIAKADASIINNDEGEPVQHLMMSTMGYARPEDLTSHLEIRHLARREEDPWDDPVSIPEDVQAAAPVIQPQPVPPGKPLTDIHAWRLPPLAPGQLLVKVRKGLAGLGGYELQDDWTTLLDVPDFPRQLEFTARGGLLSLNGERKLSVKSRGVSHIRYTVARIPLGQINHLASMTKGRFDSPVWRGWGFSEENIAHIRHAVVATGGPNDWQTVWSTFDFRESMEAPDPADADPSRGLFLIKAEAVRPRPKKAATETETAARAGGGETSGEDESAEEGEQEETDGVDRGDPDPDWQRIKVARNPLPPFTEAGSGAADSDSSEYGPSRFVLVTDLGLLVKDNTDGSRDIFVQSLQKGEPAGGVTLSLVAKNGESVMSAVTAEDGHARFEDAGGFDNDRRPVVIVARKDSDASFMPLNRDDRRLDYSRFDIGGLEAGAPGTLDAFIFTERGVYRPGDTVHAGLMVRLRSGGLPPAGLPVTVIVKNAASRPVFQQTLALPADGVLECAGQLRETDPTGVFSLEAVLFPDKPDPVLIGQTLFRVEDFQPDRMKLKATLPGMPEHGWRADPELSAVLDLQTLFGFPAAGRRITGKLTLAPADFRFPEWPDYTFHDRAPADKALQAGHEKNLGEIQSGVDGGGRFDLGLKSLDASVAFTFAAEAFELDSGRSVAVSKRGVFSPMASIVGWKADGDLSYIGKDAPRRLRLICLGPDLKAMASPALRQVLTIRRQLSILTRQPNGGYAYVSTQDEKEVANTELTIPEGGLELTLPTGETGDFRLEFRNPEGQRMAACDFTVTGKGDGGRGLQQNAELTMKTASQDWESGVNMEVSLRAPFTGAGLLTIERERVLGWKWFKTADRESIQTIPVPEGLEGTAYVQAAFVRAADSPEIFMSPLSYAVQPFRATYNRRLLPLTLETPERVRPGETLRAILRSPVPARAVVYAVDEGIHQITNYQLPNPRDFFLRPRALEVETLQILDMLIPEYTLVGRGRAFGGDGGPELNLNLNPFQRKREAPVIYWSGLVSTGPEGVAVEYPVPDYFAGQLTFMAVAAGGEGYGAAQAKTIVRGPFVLTPNVPVFAAPGDTFTLSLTVANNVENAGAEAARVAARLTGTPNITVTRSPEPADIAPGREGTMRFEIAVGEPLGNASLTFRAEAAGQSAERSVTLSVRPASPRMTSVLSGYYRQPDHVVSPQRTMYPEFAEREASVSPLPMNLARGLARWLEEFPHDCTEQIISRAMPRLLLHTDASFGFDRAAATADLTRVFARLRGRQAANGRFGLWSDAAEGGLDFLTVYAADFLLGAREAGFAVPDDLLRPAMKSLREMAALTPRGGLEQATQARAIYLLTRSGEVTTNYLLNLRDTLEKADPAWRTGPCALWLAGTHALLRQDKEAGDIVKDWRAARKPALRPWNFWQEQPLALDALDLALLSRHFPAIAGNLNYDDLQPVLTGLEKAEFNTYSAACCIQALKAWSGLQQKTGVQTSLTELADGAAPRLLAPPGAGLLTGAFTERASGLRFGLLRPEGAPDLGAYYQVVESGFDRGLPAAPVRDGLEIARRCAALDSQGRKDDLPVGTGVKMEILLRNLTGAALENLAIVDLLPGGWEVESGSLRPGPHGAPGADSVDLREDRNIFYCGLPARGTQVFTYRIRPVCAGVVTVPPVFANSLYRPAVRARGMADKIQSVAR